MQSLNLEAIKAIVKIIANPKLLVPTYSFKDITQLNPSKLKKDGIKAIIFDKDNTLTSPYSNKVHPRIAQALNSFKKEFGQNLLIVSNFVGTKDDKNQIAKRECEKNLGIKVLGHQKQKPGKIPEIGNFLKYKPEEIMVIGDNIFTDIVFGNLNKMKTTLTENLEEDYSKAYTVIKKIGSYISKIANK